MGVVDEAIQDGVSQGRVGDDGVPLVDGDLRGHDSGAGLTAIVDHLQQVARLGRCQGCEAPVVQLSRHRDNWTYADSGIMPTSCPLDRRRLDWEGFVDQATMNISA